MLDLCNDRSNCKTFFSAYQCVFEYTTSSSCYDGLSPCLMDCCMVFL